MESSWRYEEDMKVFQAQTRTESQGLVELSCATSVEQQGGEEESREVQQ